jgi:hypothetical protein
MDLEYAQRKLARSVECLVGFGTVQQRVHDAWRAGLSMIAALQAVPEDARAELKTIGEAVAADEMAAQDALRHSRRILALYERITRLHFDRQEKRAV